MRLLAAAQDVGLVLYAGAAVLTHTAFVIETGQFTSAVFVAVAMVQLVAFLTRRRSQASSTRWEDWLVAAFGCWILPLAIYPNESAPGILAGVGIGIQVVGAVGAVGAYVSLGRSLGIVAADRGLQRGGLYRVVRHPIYATQVVILVGVVLANPSPLNAALALGAVGFQLLRIRSEERFLRAHTSYDGYAAAVRWRLVPGLY